ncbi:putative transmembrane protein [Cocos nucifera]|uniref:Putative transmembrane protein n=1 Tax=Cocos nucifera TaxID=13894 RepID=A0A8K0I3F6_COCNU|nr:putative transmembrane protein [Cocos nucifera]
MSPPSDDGGSDRPASPSLEDPVVSGETSPDSARPRCRIRGPPAAPRPARPVRISRTEEEWRRFRRCVEATGKGFVIGAGLKGGLALFSILVRLRSRRSAGSSARKMRAITNEEAVVEAVKETLRYGLFLGTFAGTFVSVDECIAAIRGNKR